MLVESFLVGGQELGFCLLHKFNKNYAAFFQ